MDKVHNRHGEHDERPLDGARWQIESKLPELAITMGRYRHTGMSAEFAPDVLAYVMASETA